MFLRGQRLGRRACRGHKLRRKEKRGGVGKRSKSQKGGVGRRCGKGGRTD